MMETGPVKMNLLKLALISLFTITPMAAQLAPNAPADPKDRIRAIRDLAKQMDEGIPGITAYLHDPVTSVRLEAVQRLNDISGPRILDALITLAADNDPEVQLHAIDGLINVFVPGYLKSGVARTAKRDGNDLKVKFNDPGDLVTDGYVSVPQEVVAAVLKVLESSPSLEARADAARALGIFRARAAVPALGDALYSKDTRLMYESLVAMQKIRDMSAGPKLAFLVRDLDPQIQSAALRAVGILRTEEAAPSIRTLLDDQPEKNQRREAAQALAMIALPEDRGLFLRLLSDKDAEIRAIAAEGLARIKNPADAARLSEAFESEGNYGARLSAAFAVVSLGRLQISEFSPFRYLINALNRNSYRSSALAFLTELARDPGARQTLYPNLDRATRDEKTGLCLVLAESGEQDSIAPLNRLKDDDDLDVSQVCLRSLRTLEARLR